MVTSLSCGAKEQVIRSCCPSHTTLSTLAQTPHHATLGPPRFCCPCSWLCCWGQVSARNGGEEWLGSQPENKDFGDPGGGQFTSGVDLETSWADLPGGDRAPGRWAGKGMCGTWGPPCSWDQHQTVTGSQAQHHLLPPWTLLLPWCPDPPRRR